MANELAVRPNQQAVDIYSRVTDPLGFSKEMAKSLCLMTGAPLDAGPAVAMTMLCEGLTPMEVSKRYHFIEGKPTKKAEAMLAEWRINYGGSHRVVERSPDRAAIVLINHAGEEVYAGELTMTEANEEKWPWKKWQDHSQGYKDNWATPRGRMTMLWARLISDSVAAVCPEIRAGVYTPEEVMDFEPTNQSAAVAKPATPTIEERIATANAAKVVRDAGSIVAGPVEGEIIEGEIVESQTADDEAPPEDPSAPGSIRRHQGERIRQLFGMLGMTHEQQENALAKRRASVIPNLSSDDAKDLLDRLEAAAAEQGLTGKPEGE